MRAELKSIRSSDVEDIRTWAPTAPGFAILAQLMVGAVNESGEESVDVTICDSEWLRRRAETEGVVSGGGTYVLELFNYDEIWNYFAKRVGRCAGATWSDVGIELSKIGRWEFEEYAE